MSYDQYNMVFMIGLVMAGVFLLLSVLLLFVLRIPAVIGYLSGSTERKAISEIRKGNAKGHADAAGGDPQIAVSHTANLGGTGAGGRRQSSESLFLPTRRARRRQYSENPFPSMRRARRQRFSAVPLP